VPRNPLNPRRGIKNKLTGRQNKRRSKKPDPAISARMKLRWQDPAFRAKMKARDELYLSKRTPTSHRRSGVPDGMTRAMVKPLWDRAYELADRFIQILKDKGQL
jgi:hypothetical protein